MQQTEETTTEPKPKCGGAIFFVSQGSIVNRELVQCLCQILVLISTHWIDRREHNLLSFLITGDGLVRRTIKLCNRIADFNILDTFYSSHDVSYFAGSELFFGDEFHLIVPKLINFKISPQVHKVDHITRLKRAFHNANLKNHATELIKMGVEYERL